MQHIRYQDNQLYCEDIPLHELVEEFDTPLYVYSKNQIVENFRALDTPLAGTNHVICYALKANSNVSLLKVLANEGAGADVVSAGELYLALKAGFSPEKIAFAGVGKREGEIEYALKEGIYSINVESTQELQLISLIAMRLHTKARISLRVNPDIDAESHPYITTGLRSNKFGISGDKALEAFRLAATLSSIEVIGVHTHIGSQITKVEPFVEAAKYVAGLVAKLREANILIHHIDFGGGFGVQYADAVRHEAVPVEENNSAIPALGDFVTAVLPILQPTGCSLWLEPGRSIVANAGILLTKVLYTKENGTKKFVVVDAGMNDLIRPSLYNAHHQIVPLKIETYEHEKVDIVGPICETGDFLARDRMLSKVKRNDGLAVMTTGAYGFVNTSNYNARLHPAEIMVNGEKVRVIRERQTLEQL
ncbi:MAG: diaminopimelate decarboxylase [Ignavibacteriales bacterium]|nr:diaminopimelate decarboxylase [Ignavibacteriales bacterium]